MLSELVQDHKNVLNLLAEGFRECTKHIEVSVSYWYCFQAVFCILQLIIVRLCLIRILILQNPAPVKHFLDRTLTSRLGIRLLAEHHIGLHEEKVCTAVTNIQAFI